MGHRLFSISKCPLSAAEWFAVHIVVVSKPLSDRFWLICLHIAEDGLDAGQSAST